MLTRQQIFDKAWTGLKAQGFKQSRQPGGGCLYRGPDGLRCAIGHVIPDDEYHPDFEGEGADCVRVLDAAGIPAEFEDFSCELQDIHDSSDTPADMENNLRVFAAEFSLTVPDDGEAS